MKRLLKRVLKAAWRSTEPIRRPILAKLENFLRRALRTADQGLLQETDVLMDQVVRELIRLQDQVQAMQQVLMELLAAQAHEVPAIAGEIEPTSRPAPGEQLRAG
jgi:hypothetical protein